MSLFVLSRPFEGDPDTVGRGVWNVKTSFGVCSEKHPTHTLGLILTLDLQSPDPPDVLSSTIIGSSTCDSSR